uniref:Chemokine interleukin-8-like domain-containing protein n=1 Tax=Neogobius melanostomus TaxID=47308 RepID=A0A8C6SLX0_9GOBI
MTRDTRTWTEATETLSSRQGNDRSTSRRAVFGLDGFVRSVSSPRGLPNECCFHFYVNPLPKNKVDDYRLTSPYCAKKGIIVTMQNGKEFCVNPDQQWVKDITNDIDQKKSG